jgi:ATP-dependent protease HslVU (ClpYQ) peptidase subunit
MTCIAGLIDKNGKGHIASDSLGSNGYTKSNYKNNKIFRKGELLRGYTSSYRMGQLLEHSLTLPARKVSQTIESYMYVDFVNAVRILLKDHGYLKVDSNRESIGNFLIITEGRIFGMQDDMSLLESADGFDACGSGEDYATAALYILAKQGKLGARAMLTQAIETASKYIATVGGDIRYIHQ